MDPTIDDSLRIGETTTGQSRVSIQTPNSSNQQSMAVRKAVNSSANNIEAADIESTVSSG